MPAPPFHPQEAQRLVSVCGLKILNTGRAPIFDFAAHQAATLCGAPMGLVTLIGEFDQEFMGTSGIGGDGTPRQESFCGYTILQDEPMVVEDAQNDPRFIDNPSVLGSPYVRFYAGVPFNDRSGLPLGSLCIIDSQPHEISMQRLLVLQRLASIVSVVLEARRTLVELPGLLPSELPHAIRRLESSMEPLFGRTNGFRSVAA